MSIKDIPEDDASAAETVGDRLAAEMTELDAGNAGKTVLASKLKLRPLIRMKTVEL